MREGRAASLTGFGFFVASMSLPSLWNQSSTNINTGFFNYFALKTIVAATFVGATHSLYQYNNVLCGIPIGSFMIWDENKVMYFDGL